MEYKIKESGVNGKVKIENGMIVRTMRKFLGKNDSQTIPVASVTHTEIDRQLIGSDTLKAFVGQQTFQWKMPEAQSFVNELMAAKQTVDGMS